MYILHSTYVHIHICTIQYMYVLMLVGSWSVTHGEVILAELITGNMYIRTHLHVCTYTQYVHIYGYTNCMTCAYICCSVDQHIHLLSYPSTPTTHSFTRLLPTLCTPLTVSSQSPSTLRQGPWACTQRQGQCPHCRETPPADTQPENAGGGGGSWQNSC